MVKSLKNIFVLSKVLLKSGFYLTDEGKSKGDRKSSNIVVGLLLCICFIPLMGMIGTLSWNVCKLTNTMGVQNLLPGLFLTALTLLTFILGIVYVLNVFFFSADIENLMYMPVKPIELLSARFVTVLFYEYISLLVFAAIPMVIYGIWFGSFMYWIYALLTLVMLPVFPVAVGVLISLLIMPLLNKIKNKDVVKILAGILIIIVAFGFSFSMSFMGSSSTGLTSESVQELIKLGDISIFGAISKFLPSVRFMSISLVNSMNLEGFLYMLASVAFTLLVIAVLMIPGKFLYLKGIRGLTQGSMGKKYDSRLLYSEIKNDNSKLYVFRQYCLKEIRILFRTPMYFMNCVISSFIFPICMLIFTIVAFQNEGMGIAELRNNMVGDFAGLSASLLVVIGFAAGMFLGCMNMVSSSAISRDGGNFNFNKYIPLPYNTLIWAKIVPSVLLSALSILPIIIVAYVLFPIPLWSLAVILPSILIGILIQSIIGILLDITMPKLNWSNEAAAVKQNFNGVICMVAVMLIIGIEIAIIALMSGTLFGEPVITFVTLLLPVILLVGGIFMLRIYGTEKISKLSA